MQPYWREPKFWRAVAVLMGTMVGVGIYGIPFVFAKAGFWVGAAWLIVLALVMVLFDLLFAELTLRTSGVHQVVGYATIWLGNGGRCLMSLANVLGLYAALLAYIIVVGEFLHNVLSQFITVDPQFYSIAFAIGWSLFWFLRVRTLALVELILAGMYVAVIVLMGVISASHLAAANIHGWTPAFWYLPYGVLFFALSGMTAIPLQRQLLSGRERQMKTAIIVGVTTVAILYLFFAFIVVGVSGEVTTPEAISGLFEFLHTPVVIIGSLLGLLTISTSYLILGTALFETFSIDYQLHPLTAWLLAVTPPLLLFSSGLRNFIDVIGLAGALAGGMEAVLILIAYLRARRSGQREPEIQLRISRFLVWGLMGIFIVGGMYAWIAR